MRVIDDVVDDDIADMLLEQRIMFTDAIIKLLEQKNLTKEEADLIGVTKVMWEEIERHV